MSTMTKAELEQEIAKLEPVAATLGFAEKAKLVRLQNKLDGMALDDISAKLEGAPQVDADALRQKVQAAQQATEDRKFIADAFNQAINLVTGALGIVL